MCRQHDRVASAAVVSGSCYLDYYPRPINAGAGSQGICPALTLRHGIGTASVPLGDAITGINRADSASENSCLVRRVAQATLDDSGLDPADEIAAVTAAYDVSSLAPGETTHKARLQLRRVHASTDERSLRQWHCPMPGDCGRESERSKLVCSRSEAVAVRCAREPVTLNRQGPVTCARYL